MIDAPKLLTEADWILFLGNPFGAPIELRLAALKKRGLIAPEPVDDAIEHIMGMIRNLEDDSKIKAAIISLRQGNRDAQR